MYRLLFFLLLLPGTVSAQRWRIQMSGGGVTSVNMGRVQGVQYGNHFPAETAGHSSPLDLVGGLCLTHSDSVWEYGLSAQMLPLHFRDPKNVDNDFYIHHIYLGRPAVPITAIINYGHNRRSSHAYIGVNAGLVSASGRVTEDFDQLNGESNLTVSYNSGLGYTFGLQAGYRRSWTTFDFGFQFQANYAHLSLQHGTRPEKFDFALIYLPVQVYLGYRL